MTVPGITVITASMPHRTALLHEAIASVQAQVLPAFEHLVDVDPGVPVAFSRNRLLNQVRTEWVAFLDDDDLLDPNHLAVLADAAFITGADVVIPYCRFDGPELAAVNRPYDREALRSHGIFPLTVLARTMAVRAAGCFDPADTWEDWSLWNRMADLGCRFETVPVVTWTYRTDHGGDRRTHQIAEGRAPESSPAARRAARNAARDIRRATRRAARQETP